MSKPLSDYRLKFNKFLSRVRKHLNNKELITNILSNVIITLGVVLIVGGLYLMILDPGTSNQSVQTTVAARAVTDTTAWIPGLPFFVSDISGCSITAIGLVSWVMGINLLLTGLGIWIRHRLARLVALAIFSLSAAIQFAQFMLNGTIGSPYSIVLLLFNGVIAYFLFTRFDSSMIELKKDPLSNTIGSI
jgi:hypothetical protein